MTWNPWKLRRQLREAQRLCDDAHKMLRQLMDMNAGLTRRLQETPVADKIKPAIEVIQPASKMVN